MEVATLHLDPSIDDPEKVEDELSKLKLCGLNEDNSVCFMFASPVRGQYVFEEAGVEARTFAWLFPKTPLVGLYGEEVFGWDHLPNNAMGGAPKPLFRAAMDYWEMVLEESTMFFFVSFGPDDNSDE